MRYAGSKSIPMLMVQSLLTLRRKNDATRFCPNPFKCADILINKAHLQAFNRFFAVDDDDMLLTYFYLHAQKVQLHYMLKGGFPFTVLGLVHTRNVITKIAAFDCNSAFEIKLTPQLVSLTDSKSSRLSFVCRFTQNNQVFLSCESIYSLQTQQDKQKEIQHQINSSSAKRASKNQILIKSSEHYTPFTIDLLSTTGRQYAKLSGDFNPIHLHQFGAKLFGFEQPIAHGMYMASKCLAQIEQQRGEKVNHFDVTFKKPVLLENSVNLLIENQADEFVVSDAEAEVVYLCGLFTG